MSDKKYATKEDWKYLEDLVEKNKIDLKTIGKTIDEKLEERERKLLKAVCMNKNVLGKYIEDGRDVNIHYYKGETLLMEACFVGDIEAVDKLLLEGANINAKDVDGDSPLYCACYNGCKDIVEKLIKRGANIENENVDKVKSLHIASHEGHEKIVKILLDNGADINSVTKTGNTALGIACEIGHKNIAKLLINRGADVNILDKDRSGALHKACYNGFKNIVRLLIDSGANINVRMNFPKFTPLMLAKNRKHKDIVNMLKKEKRRSKMDLKAKADELRRERLIRDLVDACEREDGNKVESIINNMKEIPDEYIIRIINVFNKKVLKVLIKKVGDVKISEMLNMIEDTNKCNDIVDEIYKRVKLADVTGRAKILLQTKVDQEIRDICENGTRLKDLKKLLGIADITNDYLLEMINLARDNAVVALVSNSDVDRINSIFMDILEGKHDIIVGNLYKQKDVLKITTGELRELLYEKIKGELIEAHNTRDKVYKGVLLNTGIEIDLSEFDNLSVRDRFREGFVEQSEYEGTTLIDAIVLGDESKIRLLRHNKREINKVDENGKTALMYAIEIGYVELAIDMINNGADVHVKDNNNKSVLMYAIESDDNDMVSILVDKEVDVEAMDNSNKSVFMYALERGETMKSIINSLIQEANYKEKDNSGMSVLMYACQGGYLQAVKRIVELIPKDIRTGILDYERELGDTVLSIAAENDYEEVAKYLLRKGANNIGKLKEGKIKNFRKWQQDVKRDKRIKIIVKKMSSRDNLMSKN